MPTPNQARACDGRSAATGRLCSAVATHAARAPEVGAHVYPCPEHTSAHPGPWTPLDGRAAGSALPTPREIAERFQPIPEGDRPDHGAGRRNFAEDVASAYQDVVCAALEAEARAADEESAAYGFVTAETADRKVALAVKARTLRAFAARLRGAP